ncbi:hypothetical protein B0H10DRAFT_722569 [Mycena sp. CBHHK59/15]|nr:hypothetical protein B0H10DRAFT_722569 [Mycena sp. CBHHK59/15]
MAYQSHLSGHDMEASQSTGPGAFFPHAQHFIVAGGAFTSVINYFPAPSHIAPSEFADFRVIRLGDMDLRREIRLEQGSRMDAGHGPSSGLRRIHAVRLVGCASDMTAIVYQGRNAEKEWRREIHNYSGIRHPNIAQLFGIVSSDRLYATIFHDEWIPIQHFLTLFSDSVVATTYLKAHLGTELWVR